MLQMTFFQIGIFNTQTKKSFIVFEILKELVSVLNL